MWSTSAAASPAARSTRSTSAASCATACRSPPISRGLYDVLAEGNPAPYACLVDVPEAGLEVVSASPELFLRRRGDHVQSRPIKGTAEDLAAMLPKDYAENVMIADLVRNDLARVCRPGTVGVDALCAAEEHPGLVHLVTTVSGRLRPGVGWAEIAGATLPPGSVSGAPKSSALRTIAELETAPRGPYCGAVGWVDADAGEASWRWASAPSGPTETRTAGAGCASARAPASRGARTRGRSGRRRS